MQEEGVEEELEVLVPERCSEEGGTQRQTGFQGEGCWSWPGSRKKTGEGAWLEPGERAHMHHGRQALAPPSSSCCLNALCPSPGPFPGACGVRAPQQNDSLLLHQDLTQLLRMWLPSRAGFLTQEGLAWGGVGMCWGCEKLSSTQYSEHRLAWSQIWDFGG